MLDTTIETINILLLESAESITIILLKLTEIVFIVCIKLGPTRVARVKIRVAIPASISLALLLLVDHLGVSWRG